MKLPKLPEQSDKPRNLRETLYSTTPVVLTVLATILAGLSSGELTRSQYYRSMAAQRQAKASDQWGYYQAKRLRAVEAQNSLDLLGAMAHPGRLDPSILFAASKELGDRAAPLDKALRAALADADSIAPFSQADVRLPAASDQPINDPDVNRALAAVEQGQTEARMAPLLRRITDDQLTAALGIADGNLTAFDQSIARAGAILDRLRAIFSAEAEAARDGARRRPSDAASAAERDVTAAAADVAAARFRFAAARYDREAKYNSVSAELYEVEVRQSGVISDRLRVRSSHFFYAMLAAQGGVTISTLSLAVKRRSIGWALAAATGAAAVGFSGYVYLYT